MTNPSSYSLAVPVIMKGSMVQIHLRIAKVTVTVMVTVEDHPGTDQITDHRA